MKKFILASMLAIIAVSSNAQGVFSTKMGGDLTQKQKLMSELEKRREQESGVSSTGRVVVEDVSYMDQNNFFKPKSYGEIVFHGCELKGYETIVALNSIERLSISKRKLTVEIVLSSDKIVKFEKAYESKFNNIQDLDNFEKEYLYRRSICGYHRSF